MATSSNSTTVKAGGTATAFTNEATTKLTANTVYQITDATKRVLDPDTAIVVEVDPDGGGASPYAPVAVSTYTVDYMFGKITFTADQGASATVRIASGKYIPPLSVLSGTDFELDDGCSLIESTVFGGTYKSRIKGLDDVSGSFTTLELLTTDLDPGAGTTKLRTAMRAGTKLLLEYQPGGAATYWRAWVLLSDGSEKASLDARLEGTLKFATVTPLGVGENEFAVPTWGT